MGQREKGVGESEQCPQTKLETDAYHYSVLVVPMMIVLGTMVDLATELLAMRSVLHHNSTKWAVKFLLLF